jgi:hypothetical protein
MSSFPTWVNLPNFPMELWMDEGLQDIEEDLCSFITTDQSYKSSFHFSVAQFLVALDPRKGLFESLDLVWGDRTLHMLWNI